MVKAPYRVPIGHAPLRGSGGIPPQNFFEIWMLKGAIWCSLGDLKRQNCISFAQLYLPSFSIKLPNVPQTQSIFKFCCNEICNKIAYSTLFCIKLIDTTVNNYYITVQEQWKIHEITITMCLHCDSLFFTRHRNNILNLVTSCHVLVIKLSTQRISQKKFSNLVTCDVKLFLRMIRWF